MSTTLPTRFARLLSGLVLFGVSVALLVRADLGLASWDVLHQGLAEWTGLPLGLVVNAVAVAVLLLWIPLRQRPGVGTVGNAVVVGLAVDAALAVLPQVGPLTLRIALLVAGIVLNGVATALYLGARLGPGPRDGLMTGLAARGLPIRRVRTLIELAVLAVGWLLGGAVGPGTLLYAVGIGPIVHHLIPRFALPAPAGSPDRSDSPCPA
ncbi:hypothetical protein ABT214_28560 [Micromonospora purpureochromogenes]|uniref:membrane protein YczE n=1 Tax=Micromonospora purpureochromogenes TaxID=47872 RepID=UPI00333332B5